MDADKIKSLVDLEQMGGVSRLLIAGVCVMDSRAVASVQHVHCCDDEDECFFEEDDGCREIAKWTAEEVDATYLDLCQAIDRHFGIDIARHWQPVTD